MKRFGAALFGSGLLIFNVGLPASLGAVHQSQALTPFAYLPLVVALNDGTVRLESTPTPIANTLTATPAPISSPETATPTPEAEATAEMTATHTPSPTPMPSCAVIVDAAQAPNSPILIVDVSKQRFPEIVTLQNVSDTTIDLTGWRMCSLNGGQQHRGITGLLQAGETRDFAHVGNPIWDDTTRDDGALFDPSGKLISYWAEE